MSGPLLETRFGRLRGVAGGGVRAFLGVPFAAPPLGPERFRAPRPPEPWRGEREAVAFGAPAPQTRGLMARLLGLPREPSEDCLTLNVWTPEPGRGRRPILVWIHGGSFTSGAGASPVYDGAALAARGDAVVVTLHYRLGVLGFLPLSGGEEGAANRGLLDQLAGLAWVREHAEALGGDPERITLFGESAGAMSIATLLASPAARGAFAGAVCQSGGAEHVHDAEAAARVRHYVLGQLGVSDDADAPRRLAEVPLGELLRVQEEAVAALWRQVPGLVFQPAATGPLVPERPLETIAAGRAARVPLVAGTNADEYRLWSLTDPKATTLDEAGLLRRLRRTIRGAAAPGARLAEAAVAVYREARLARGEAAAPSDLWFAIEGDRTLRMPTLRMAEAHAAHAPTYAYLFTWPSPAAEGRLGACHALEIPFVFGSLGAQGVGAFTGGGPEARALSESMQDAWLAFARESAPGPDWPPFTPPRRATRIFGPGPGVPEAGVVDAPREAERRFWEDPGREGPDSP